MKHINKGNIVTIKIPVVTTIVIIHTVVIITKNKVTTMKKIKISIRKYIKH